MKTINLLCLSVLIAALPLMPSCSVGSAKGPDQLAADLEKRVTELWQCRVAKNYDRKYDLMSPDIRERVGKSEFISSKGYVNYYGFEIVSLKVDKTEALAEVKYTWKANHPLFEKAEVKENITTDPWVLVDGEWFMKYRTPSIQGAQDGQVMTSPDEDLD